MRDRSLLKTIYAPASCSKKTAAFNIRDRSEVAVRTGMNSVSSLLLMMMICDDEGDTCQEQESDALLGGHRHSVVI